MRITESSVTLQKKLQLQNQVTESMPEPPGGPVESLSAMRRSASTYMTQLFRRIQEKKLAWWSKPNVAWVEPGSHTGHPDKDVGL